MGETHSKPSTSTLATNIPSHRVPWRSTRKGILSALGYSTSTLTIPEIPADNIFVPIQQDNILPQIPIGRHHPVPRKGIEDDEDRTLQTNKFYANAFLGKQNQPIWTHPYSIWWGKGWDEPGTVQTWGMCVSHIEEKDLAYGDRDPASVCLPLSYVMRRMANQNRATRTHSVNSASSSLRESSSTAHS
jgi:endo-1,3(4)-beta-glucanase